MLTVLFLGECAYKSDVKMANSLDELGRERFHPLSCIFLIIKTRFLIKIFIFKVLRIIILVIFQIGLKSILQTVSKSVKDVVVTKQLAFTILQSII